MPSAVTGTTEGLQNTTTDHMAVLKDEGTGCAAVNGAEPQ